MLFLSHLFWAVLICLLYIHADCYCRHSQNRYKTDCPTGTRKMWDGFSLAYVQGNGKAHGQELGIVDKIDVVFFADLLSCGCCAISWKAGCILLLKAYMSTVLSSWQILTCFTWYTWISSLTWNVFCLCFLCRPYTTCKSV